jgi:large subunit ribosomal protein L15
MQIHSLKLKNKSKKRKTIGRGGKKGTYSGKGNKGQKARSGGNVNPLFEGGRSTLVDHMKKKRGFTSSHPKKEIIKFASLLSNFENGAKITIVDLVAKGLVRKIKVKNGIKILGPTDGKTKFTFEEKILLSKSVQK